MTYKKALEPSSPSKSKNSLPNPIAVAPAETSKGGDARKVKLKSPLLYEAGKFKFLF